MLRRSLFTCALLPALVGCGGSGSKRVHVLWAGAPAQFRPAVGWHVRASGSSPLSPDMHTITVAGTVPWRDPLDAPPQRTLPALRASSGIEIFVALEAGRLFQARPPSTHLRLGPLGEVAPGAGPAIAGLSAQGGAFVVARRYVVGVTVIYGSSRLAPADEARARAELARLVLPRWPHWWRG